MGKGEEGKERVTAMRKLSEQEIDVRIILCRYNTALPNFLQFSRQLLNRAKLTKDN